MLPHIPSHFEFIHFKSAKDLPHLILVLFMILGIGLGVYLALQPQIFTKQASESGKIDLKFIPEVLKVQTGGTYEIKIAVNPKGDRVTAAKLSLEYDPRAISILETKNSGFLPVDLKTENDFNGSLTLVYGSTIESESTLPGMLSTIKFRVINPFSSEIRIKTDSEINVSSVEENVLKDFPKVLIESVDSTLKPGEEVKYPDNLLLEKAFFASSEPTVRDFKESREPKPEIKPGRVRPGFSEAFIKQLGHDIFISPILALNEVLEEKASGILGK